MISDLLKRGGKSLSDNSPALLTALGVSGTLTTAFLAGKASWRAAQRLGEEPPFITRREKFDKTWKLYIPAGISGAVTVTAIVAATRISTRRAAAAYSLLTVSERAFSEYKDKVVEILGEKKEQNVRDQIAQERVTNNPPNGIILGSGNVLCCELLTGRYFNSDMQTLLKAQNDINNQLNHHMWATLDDFYDMVGLQTTQYSDSQGWEAGKLVELKFTTAMTQDGRPCLAFEYNYVKPIH